MAQLQRLFFIYLAEHIKNTLTAGKILGVAVEEDRRWVGHSAGLVVVYRLVLWLGKFGIWSFSAEKVQKGSVAG